MRPTVDACVHCIPLTWEVECPLDPMPEVEGASRVELPRLDGDRSALEVLPASGGMTNAPGICRGAFGGRYTSSA